MIWQSFEISYQLIFSPHIQSRSIIFDGTSWYFGKLYSELDISVQKLEVLKSIFGVQMIKIYFDQFVATLCLQISITYGVCTNVTFNDPKL